ncbi:TetR/AcrR family transcriptional regulator [Shewanella sp. MF05960]|uniref:TetR/AcrR family transcriptional regulator n=1 Tax=Shewanella sp. MF05960 TaxID=3434874 RepID=UPI003D7992B2
MPETTIFQPKQRRSQDTQQKLIAALHHCLQDKFFEHISIKDLAEHAGVSVGTFYRRFKDKESLLPLLYQDFGHDLDLWVSELEQQHCNDLTQALQYICQQTCQFLCSRQSIFRTLHLNSRLHSEIIASDKLVNRENIYQRISALILRHQSEITVIDKSQSADLAVFMMVSTLLDKVLYPTLTPALASKLSLDAFAAELPKVLVAYLKSA